MAQQEPERPARILVGDDDPRIVAAVHRALAYEGWDVQTAVDGPSALRSARERPPDLVVLDVMLPGLNGTEVCRRLRAGGDVSILMLTALDGTADRVRGLDSGADDYLVKPFSYEELLARVRAILRRRALHQQAETRSPPPVLRFADLTLDTGTREVSRGDRAIPLTALEFDLLEYFLRQPRLVLSRAQIVGAVWGFDASTASNVVDVYVGYLRNKLESDGEARLLHTVRGVGYVLKEG